MDKGLSSEPRILSEQHNVISRQYDRGAAQTERANIELNPNKTHQYQILFYQIPEIDERHRVGILSH